MDRAATFDESGTYRYRLDRRWDDVGRNVAFVMLNPSTADAFVEDNTIRRCIGFAKELGFASLTVVNLFAFRATDPKQLKKAADPVGDRNDFYIRQAMKESHAVICAWGVHGALFGRDKEVAPIIIESCENVWVFGVTKKGFPKHPLYLPKDAKVQDIVMGGPVAC